MHLLRIRLPHFHSETEDNGLMTCQKAFKREEVVKLTGLTLDQVQKIGITNTLIESTTNLKL